MSWFIEFTCCTASSRYKLIAQYYLTHATQKWRFQFIFRVKRTFLDVCFFLLGKMKTKTPTHLLSIIELLLLLLLLFCRVHLEYSIIFQ